MKTTTRKLIAASIAAMMIAPPVLADLQRVGPIDPANGFPVWYQDRNGLALELCDVKSDAVLAGGWCLLLPGDVPGPAPEIFPSNWAIEHFWWAGGARLNSMGLDATGNIVPVTNNIGLTLGLESTFTAEIPRNPDQISFGRWRVRMNSAPCNGSYTFYTPYKEPQTFQAAAGDRIFETDDAGIGAPGDFTGALRSSIAPFLRPSDTSGGVPSPLVTGPDGKRYISNNADLVRSTGSPIPNRLTTSTTFGVPASIKAQQFSNYFVVEGQGVATGNCAVKEAVATETFTLMGRVFEGPLPSRTVVERVSYRVVNPDTAPAFRIGGFAHAFQEVGRPVPALGMNLFAGDPANPLNFRGEIGMDRFAVGDQTATAPADPAQPVPTPRSNFFGGQAATTNLVGGVIQAGPAVTHARIRTLTDAPPSVQDVKLVDEVSITAVDYNATTKTLTVKANSGAYLQSASTATACSVPCLTLDNFGLPAADAAGAPISYQMKTLAGTTSKVASVEIAVPNVTVPPNAVRVTSSLGGADSRAVSYRGANVSAIVLQDDFASTAMNLPVNGIDVLGNDVGYAAAGALTLCAGPTGACATSVTVNTTGAGAGTFTVGANRTVNFTPAANRIGNVVVYYSVGTLPAGTARGKLTVNIGSGVAQAIDDTGFSSVINRTLAINVLANDIIPTGVQLGSAFVVQGPFLLNGANRELAPAGTVAQFSPLNGMLEFFTPTSGTYTMEYQWTDRNGQVATPGTVVIQVQGAETLTASARYRTGTRLLTASGTSSLRSRQVIDIRNATGVADACAPNVPATLPRFGQSAPVTAVGGWDMAQVTLPVGAPTPLSLVAWSPTFGGCLQFTPTVTK